MVDASPSQADPVTWNITPPKIVQTQPDEILWHFITDDELGALADMRRDYLWEAMWAWVGLAGGAMPGAISAIGTRYFSTEPTPISTTDLSQLVLCSVGIALAVACCVIASRRSTGAKNLVKDIRGRTRRSVTGKIPES
jgi:hypothetical protein